MLHYDIYYIIGLYADAATLKNIIDTNAEISRPCYSLPFWRDKLNIAGLPYVQSPFDPLSWIEEYEYLHQCSIKAQKWYRFSIPEDDAFLLSIRFGKNLDIKLCEEFDNLQVISRMRDRYPEIVMEKKAREYNISSALGEIDDNYPYINRKYYPITPEEINLVIFLGVYYKCGMCMFGRDGMFSHFSVE